MPTSRQKNIIFLSLDTLRYDYLGFSGFSPSPSPTLDRLMASGLTATNMFATGCPTQMAMPGIITSTLTLDYGGYNQGLSNRPDSVIEVLQRNGYATVCFNSGIGGSFEGGYERGFDQFFRSWGPLGFYWFWIRCVPYLHTAFTKGEKSLEDCEAILQPFFEEFFQQVQVYCAEKTRESSTGQQPTFAPDRDYDSATYEELGRLAAREQLKFHADPHSYMKQSITREKELRLWSRLVNRVRHYMKLPGKKYFPVIDFISGLNTQSHARKEQMVKQLDSGPWGITFHPKQMEFASTGFLFNQLRDWIRQNQKTPFFAYLVTCDIHPVPNFMSFEYLKDQPSLVEEELRRIQQFRAEMQHARGSVTEDELNYLSSINYVDRQLAELITFLHEQNLADGTILVIISDHGANFPGQPARTNALVTNSFQDEFYRIPVSFVNKDIPSRQVAKLSSALDIAPTLLNLVGLDAPASFQGKSIAEPEWQERNFVLSEHMGAGICDFDLKSCLIAARNLTHKLVYVLPGIKTGKSGFVRDLFHLESDPGEQHNLAEDPEELKQAEALVQIARQRGEEIHRAIQARSA